MYHYAFLLSNFSQQFQLLKHRFKLRQKAPLSVFVFKIVLALPNFQTIFQILSKCTNQRPWFQNLISSSNYKTLFQIASEGSVQSPCFNSFLNSANFSNIDSNCIRRHHYAFLLSKFSQQFQLPKHCFNLCPKKLISVLVFKIVSALPNAQTIVSNTVKMR